MRIRTVKPEFFRHEGLQDLEIAYPGQYTMLVYQGLWGLCDSQGVFLWKPRTIKLDVLPFLDFDMLTTLEILRKGGYVRYYEAEGEGYGYIPTFNDHQRLSGKEASNGAKYPAPSEEATGKQLGSKWEATGKEEDTPEFPDNAPEKALDLDSQPIINGKQLGSNWEAPEKKPDAQERKGKEEEEEEEEGGETRALVREASPKKNKVSPNSERGAATTPPVAPPPPSWPEVAEQMAAYYLEENEGQREWLAMTRAAGVGTDAVNVNAITAIWAGKQDIGTLANWRRHTGNLTNWIKNQARDNAADSKKRKQQPTGMGATAEAMVNAANAALAELEKYD